MQTSKHLLCWFSAVALAAALPLLAAPKHPLQVGDKAPLFTGHDQDGKSWSLSDRIGKKIVLLYFYPKDDTADGMIQACGLRDNLVEFKQAGVTLAGVSTDSADTHKAYAFKYNLPFPLLADTSGDIADAYGARMPGDKKLDRRISFLIGLDGRIIHITDSPDPSVHLKETSAAIAKVANKTSL